jgi:hypothetical protein
MRSLRFIPTTIFAALSLMILTITSQGAVRTYVSAKGNDTNPCTLGSPCKTFSRALTVTNAGGEIIAVATGDYQPFTIDKAIKIKAAAGVHAVITSLNSTAITVNAGPGDMVFLENLSTTGFTTGINGIVYTSGLALYVTNCKIYDFSAEGINAVTIANASLIVTNTYIESNANAGVLTNSSSGVIDAVFDGCHINGNGHGVLILDNSNVTITNSTISGNLNHGIFMNSINFPAGPGDMRVTIDSCKISNNKDTGIIAAASSDQRKVTVRVSDSIITGNSVGLNTQGTTAVILSRKNNTVEGNTTNGAFTGLFAAK